jgi:hypothetical protein
MMTTSVGFRFSSIRTFSHANRARSSGMNIPLVDPDNPNSHRTCCISALLLGCPCPRFVHHWKESRGQQLRRRIPVEGALDDTAMPTHSVHEPLVTQFFKCSAGIVIAELVSTTRAYCEIASGVLQSVVAAYRTDIHRFFVHSASGNALENNPCLRPIHVPLDQA